MPTNLRLPTTTSRKSKGVARVGLPTTAKGRLPLKRPPTHPGEMLLEEFLKPLAITQSSFAERLGVSFQRVNEITRGKRGVTPDTALRLAQVLGMSADFWLGLQLDWDLWQALHSPQYAQIKELVPVGA